MARDIRTRSRFESMIITPNSSHGDGAGDVVFEIRALNTDLLTEYTYTGTSKPRFFMREDGSSETYIVNTAAAGQEGGYFNIVGDSTAITGTLRGIYAVATNGTSACTGTIRGGEIKGRAADSSGTGANVTTLEGLLISADTKAKTSTTLRGLHIQMDGAAGGASTLAQGLLINNNSSATQTTGYAIDINEGTASGHKVWTADIRLQYGETIDNATNGTVQVTAGVIKHAIDAAAYWTATQADAGGVTFDSVSDGTAGFAFSDKVDITGVLTVKYGASDYMSITQANAGSCTFDITTDGTANFIFSDMMTLGVDGTGVDMQLYTGSAGSNLLWDASDSRLEGTGIALIQMGEATTGYNAASPSPMIYGYYYGKTTAVTGTGIGVRGNARIIVQSTSGTAIGGKFQAGNSTPGASDGVSVAEVNGSYSEVVVGTGTGKTIVKAVGANIVIDGDQATTAVTSGMGARIAYQTGATMGTHTNTAGLAILNENVAGAGTKLGAAIIIGNISIADGFTYGIDFAPSFADGGNGTIVANTFATGAEIRLSNGETIDNATNGTIKLTTAVIKHALDADDYWTVTQANSGGVTFASTSAGTAEFTFSQAVTCSSTLAVTGVTTLSANANITYSKTAAADVGTVRACYGKYALTGSTPVTTASNNMVGARGEFNIGTGGVLSFNAGSSFATGVQGKIVASGTTTIGATTSDQDARIQAIHAQADFTGMTINGGQIALIEADVQVRPTAINGVNQFNLLKLTDADASKTTQANAIISAFAEAAFLLELNAPETNADWFATNTTSIEGNNMSYILKVKCPDGSTGYLPVLGAVPS